MNAKTIILAAALLLPVAAHAETADWTRTFEPSATGSYLEGEARGVLVVAAGEPSADLTAAAQALEQGLRGSGKAKLVMGGAGLGDVSALGDADIVRKAQPMPVDLIAIVRVFPGPVGKPATAVVTFYDKTGNATVALSAEGGVGVQARQASQPGSGVFGKAAASVAEVVSHSNSSKSAAEEEFEKRRIWFMDSALVNMNTGAVLSSWTTAYRGKYREPLEGADFYEALQRPDLASSYRTRRAVKATLGVSGFLGLISSPGLILYGALAGCVKKDSTTGECLERDGMMTTGIVVGAVGVAALIANGFIDLHPVELPAARELVDEYNEKLKKELGVAAGAGKEKDPPASLQLGGYVGPGAGGLVLSFSL